jgi:branched-chain amino acid transport system permease protein
VPLLASLRGEPFYVTLATRIAILALAGVGLNLALGSAAWSPSATPPSSASAAMSPASSPATPSTAAAAGPFGLAGAPSRCRSIWLVAMAVCGLAALAIGALSLRTSGVYFIMITLAFAQMIYYFAISWPAYGGEDGLSIYVRNAFPASTRCDPIQFFLVCYAAAAAALALRALRGSRFGAALQARGRTRRGSPRSASALPASASPPSSSRA